MAVIPYKKINWNPNDLITDTKMDTVNSNIEYLYQNMPRARYSAYGINRTEGVKIMSGLTGFAGRNAASGGANVNFGNFFAAGSHPVITTGVLGDYAFHIHVTYRGLGVFHPDHRGFYIQIYNNPPTANKTIKKTMYVSWIAMGVA